MRMQWNGQRSKKQLTFFGNSDEGKANRVEPPAGAGLPLTQGGHFALPWAAVVEARWAIPNECLQA